VRAAALPSRSFSTALVSHGSCARATAERLRGQRGVAAGRVVVQHQTTLVHVEREGWHSLAESVEQAERRLVRGVDHRRARGDRRVEQRRHHGRAPAAVAAGGTGWGCGSVIERAPVVGHRAGTTSVVTVWKRRRSFSRCWVSSFQAFTGARRQCERRRDSNDHARKRGLGSATSR
jgi:hypothetical protein